MLRIISANLNGIRSAAKKGFFDWMGKQDADMVCVQELNKSIRQALSSKTADTTNITSNQWWEKGNSCQLGSMR